MFKSIPDAKDNKENIPPPEKVFKEGDDLFLVNEAITKLKVHRVHTLRDNNVEYQCKMAESDYNFMFSDTQDNIFNTMEEAQRSLLRIETMRTFFFARSQKMVQIHTPAFSMGDAIFDTEQGFVREGKVLDVVPWPKKNGCMYYCEETSDPVGSRYAVQTWTPLKTTLEAAEEQIRITRTHHKHFNVDDIFFYVFHDCKVEAYRVVRVFPDRMGMRRYHVRDVDNCVFSVFHSDNKFIFYTIEAAEEFASVKKLENQYLREKELHCEEELSFPVEPRTPMTPQEPYPMREELQWGGEPMTPDSPEGAYPEACRRALFERPVRRRKRRELKSLLDYRPKRLRTKTSRYEP